MNFFKVIVLFFCGLAVLSKSAHADPKFQRGIYGGGYYIESTSKINWFQASHECARKGRKLVEVQNNSKHLDVTNALRSYIGSRGIFWIGANDEYKSSSKNRPFYWSSSGDRVIYTHWMWDEPNNHKGKQHCITIDSLEWNDKDCTENYGFICE
ncbi:lectin subunit alpha-like [Musca autumnalis]|uniref:lectin subunit alpha-like n=1 Tax=Musca autumnalis TaxID=221902 RepID=UPI003CECBE9B